MRASRMADPPIRMTVCSALRRSWLRRIAKSSRGGGIYSLATEIRQLAHQACQRLLGFSLLRKRAADIHGGKADACGQDTIDSSFAKTSRQPADQPLADHMLNHAVGKSEAAGHGKMADHHASEPECRERRGPSAVECGNLAQHAQILSGDEEDVEGGRRRRGSEHGHSAAAARDDAMRLAVKGADEIAIGEPDAVLRVHHLSLVLGEGLQAPGGVMAALIDTLESAQRPLGGSIVVMIEGARRIGLHMLDTVEPEQSPDLTDDDGKCGKAGEARKANAQPAEIDRACEELLDQAGRREAGPQNKQAEKC